MKRGEIRWYTFQLPDKRRPVLILTRDEVLDRLNEIIVVPATRTIPGLATEVILTPGNREIVETSPPPGWSGIGTTPIQSMTYRHRFADSPPASRI